MFTDEIYKLPLRGFEGIDLRKLLMVSVETYKFRKDLPLKKEIKRYVKSRLFDRYEYKYTENNGNKYIAFYSDWFYRQDHLKNFSDFIKEFTYFDYVIPIRLEKDKLNIGRFFKMLYYDIQYFYMLKDTDTTAHQKIDLVRILGLVRLYGQKMNRYIKMKDYQYGLVYSDSCPYENLLIQMMRKDSLDTGTLQHGLFNIRNIYQGIEFRASVADDFLAWNEYTRDLALECDVPYQKIKVLGIPRYIYPKNLSKEKTNGVFSVILGGKVLKEENERLIHFANEVAFEKGLKYFLRYHPSCLGNEYNEIVNDNYYIGNEANTESIKEMCQKSDFSLVGSGTSVVIDLIYLDHPFFEYMLDWDGGEYQKRKNYFRNLQDLLIHIKKDMNIEDSVFKYYCTTREVYDSYDAYFKSKCNGEIL